MKFHNMKPSLRLLLPAVSAMLLMPALSSCLKDKDDGLDTWKSDNDKYFVAQMDTTDAAGQLYYERYTPVWQPGITLLIRWHKRPADYATRMKPMDNSLVNIKYEGRLYNGTVFNNSYSSTTYGDSIYRCRPSALVPGFWAALTQMVPGDSVTVVIPSQAGYGASGHGSSIKPYSALTFDIKLKDIVAWDSPQ